MEKNGEMIKAHELRIGSWLKDGEEYTQISGYGIHAVQEGTMTVRPIPLTPEILEKVGFVDGFLEIEDQAIQISQGLFYLYGSQSCTHGQTFAAEIKYVHQLQNLYFALTGEELTISL